MKNATIATSRTRATSADLIDYRPLPEAWGDVEALHALRASKARAAESGVDPSTLEITAVPESSQAGSSQAGSSQAEHVRHHDAPRRAPLGLLRRERGAHRRGHRRNGHLAAA